MTQPRHPPFRRTLIVRALGVAALAVGGRSAVFAQTSQRQFVPERRWYEAALAQLRLAESWGDQPYGAVVVADGEIIGSGASQVRKRNDGNAHAEREAIRAAQARLGRQNLAGSVLYSTSRPCRLCELAAAQAQVARMIHGEALTDAGAPQAN